MTASITQIHEYREEQTLKHHKALGKAVHILAQEAQRIKAVSEEEVYYKLLSLIVQGLDRVTLVQTLEKHDDSLDSNIRFGIIDIYDFIIAKSEKQERVQRILAEDKRRMSL